ncbi:hypothetical protein RBG61_09200 [Paludicola sp. MB14-C6]|uniref:hypothetical protein n=1 Tax=Paludihabitans sp. MB14-C6 TaxID=3070656 RepID=UPI0027DC7498|nr:hypothetical protein [Paludicola sp. MB14-C6]WMJ22174.1 hypothetical protein RBG61_09200 [Paludicola sp. MB14-C6]
MDNNMSQRFTQQDIQATKGLACLSYLGILLLIPLLVNKNSAFTKYHVNQGLILLIIEAITIGLAFVLGLIPFVGAFILWVLRIAIIALAVIGIVNCVEGFAKPLPVIGGIQIIK